MREQIEAHRNELAARLTELHEHAERTAVALSATAVAQPPAAGRDAQAAVSGDLAPAEPRRDGPDELVSELAALRAELEQARDAAREQGGRSVQATGALDELHRAEDELRHELSELERRRATVEAQTHTLQRQLAERTQEATRAGEQARALAQGLERVREDERDRAGALRQAEVSLSRLRASAVDLGAGLEREREAHAQVAAPLHRELEEQRRTHEASAQEARRQASTLAVAQGSGVEQAAAVIRDVGAQLCERLRGLERSVDGFGDGLRAAVERRGPHDRQPLAPAEEDDPAEAPERLAGHERRAAGPERTAELERTARELIGTARRLRGAYDSELGTIQRDLEARLEHQREAHARELAVVRERVDRLRRELGQADRVLRTELAAEQRARHDAERQLVVERERARARERVRLELERALEVERERAGEERKAAVELTRALAQRVGSERRAHRELDRLRAELAREPLEAPSGSVEPQGGVPEAHAGQEGDETLAEPHDVTAGEPDASACGEAPSPAPGPLAGEAPAREGTADVPGPPLPPPPSAAPPGPTTALAPGAPRRRLDSDAFSDTLTVSGRSTADTPGAQAPGEGHGAQRNGAWNGEISAARLTSPLRSSAGSHFVASPASVTEEPGGDASTALAPEGLSPGGEMAEALTRAVKRLRDRADAAQAAPPDRAHGALRRPGQHTGGTGSPGSAPASWPASLRPPSRLDALRGRPGCAAPPARPVRHAPLPVIPGAVALSALSPTALRQTTSHPWLAGAIRRLAAGGDPALAGALVAELLPAQGLRCRRALDFEIDIQESGAFLVSADGRGRATVVARPDGDRVKSELRLRGTAWQLAELIAGGAGRELPGVQVQGRRRGLRRLLRSRRLPVSLAELAAAGVCPWPGLLLAALVHAVPAQWTRGEDFTVAVAMMAQAAADTGANADAQAAVGADANGNGSPHRGSGRGDGDDDRAPGIASARSVGESSLHVRVRAGRGLEVGDGPPSSEPAATLHVRERELLDLLGGTAASELAPALVSGDPQVVHRLLAWFHRAQGLAA